MHAIGQPRPVGRATRVIAPVVLVAVAILAWQAATWSGRMPATVLPPPAAVAARLTRDLGSGTVGPRIATTLGEALAGCLVAALIALPLGYVLARWPVAEAAASPLIAASQAIPAMAIAPLLVIWIGYGTAPVVALCALIVFFPMVLATVLGLRHVEPDLLAAAALDGAGGASLLIHLQWPLARRTILTGLRGGFTLSITGAVVGEFVMGGRGLGELMSAQMHSYDTTGMFATIIVLCLLAVAIYLVIWAVEVLTDPLRPVPTREVPT